MQSVTFRFDDLGEMQHAMTIAGARMALRVDADQHATSAQWALAVFEIATGKRATAAAGRVVSVGEEIYIEFDRRDWDRLTEFATPWSEASGAASVDVSEDAPRQSARAVVVEDERVSREMVTSFLLGLGLVVRPASTAERAIELLDKESFDMAVLDLALPGMSGLELCEAIRHRTDSLQSLPILILTADTSDEMAKRSFRAGADDFITKPVPVLEFRARVLALLRRGRGSSV